jgi:hypothetical protein
MDERNSSINNHIASLPAFQFRKFIDQELIRALPDCCDKNICIKGKMAAFNGCWFRAVCYVQEPGIMRHPQREPIETLFAARAIGLICLDGPRLRPLLLGAIIGSPGCGEPRPCRLALITSNLAIIIVNRSYSQLFVRALRTANPIFVAVAAIGTFPVFRLFNGPAIAAILCFMPPAPA